MSFKTVMVTSNVRIYRLMKIDIQNSDVLNADSMIVKPMSESKIHDPSILMDGCESIGISLTDLQVRQLVRYYEMLYEKNKVMNLTAVTDWESVQTKHYLDSLLLARVINLTGNLRVLDLGTGAGFPGVVLKIVFPQLEMVLMDSLKKRLLFLDDVIRELNLPNIRTVHGRAEDLGRKKEYRSCFDLVVSRAVSNLSSLSEYCLPFVKEGGTFISYKSSGIEEEVKQADHAIRILGGGRPTVVSYPLPGTDVMRSFVCIKKTGMTPAKYPRKAGTPGKDPL